MFKKPLPNNFIPISGSNFSGRSEFLDSLNDKGSNRKVINLGEIPSNYISGLVPTVENEIGLHATKASPSTLQNVKELLDTFEFQRNFSKNPFLLSGGEKTVLIILSHLLLDPDILTIDTLIEQLNKKWREPLLNKFRNGDFPRSKLYLVDNRLKEYNVESIPINNLSKPNINNRHSFTFDKPKLIRGFTSKSQPKTIGLNQITFSYSNGEKILSNVDAQFKPGFVYELNGPNGVGKSTLAKIITGLLELDDGHLTVNGKSYISYKYPGGLASYSFQNPDEQIFSATVEEEIIPFSIDSKIEDKRRDIFLKIFGLEQIKKNNPAELPFVMRKRISIAASLASDRPWYILDEPTIGQDDDFIKFLADLLNYLAKRGKGIIIISHSQNFSKYLNGINFKIEDKKILF